MSMRYQHASAEYAVLYELLKKSIKKIKTHNIAKTVSQNTKTITYVSSVDRGV